MTQPDDLADRLARIEQRLDALEGGGETAEVDDSDPFWALRRMHDAVLFTGAVGLPGGEHYEWQQTVPAEGILESDWTMQAPALAALAHPARVRILREVLLGTRSAADLQALDGIESTGQLYHHVRQLVAAGWLRTEARARYTVPAERVVPLLVIIACAQH
ncbi:helix-turn-helix domain-containing protein [Paractinoplanes toevensis]|uniref:Transcriptional regulator n=1 Tax=Paractinoplanes toevensis TaxID=571911 RepID=A0A919T8B5_9ACTN|nr:helix-turn-helix domain-containing protein [Actinoplanes toevensis]GIM90983.1 transcriptional regulator [Actinoplanes toevensis]